MRKYEFLALTRSLPAPVLTQQENLFHFADVHREPEFQLGALAVSSEGPDMRFEESVIEFRPLLTCHTRYSHRVFMAMLRTMGKLKYS
jgi:hypothetical protein